MSIEQYTDEQLVDELMRRGVPSWGMTKKDAEDSALSQISERRWLKIVSLFEQQSEATFAELCMNFEYAIEQTEGTDA